MSDKKERIVILGNGLLGSNLFTYLKKQNLLNNEPRHIVQWCPFISNDNFIAEAEELVARDFDYIINCIGSIPQNDPGIDFEEIYLLNTLWPMEVCNEISKQKKQTRFINFSTDCVFEEVPVGYNKRHLDFNSHYSKSKYLAESLSNHGACAVIRTSFVGLSFVDDVNKMLKRNSLFEWAVKQKEIIGYENVLWHGVTTLQLARAIEWAIDKKEIFYGCGQTHDFFTRQPVSKYTLLKQFTDVLNNRLQSNISVKSNLADGESADVVTKITDSVRVYDLINFVSGQERINALVDFWLLHSDNTVIEQLRGKLHA